MTPKLITSSGIVREILPENGEDFSLEELRAIVGGNVEVAYPPSATGALLIVNEDGKDLRLPVNETATRLWKEHDPSWPDFVVGNAILMPSSFLK